MEIPNAVKAYFDADKGNDSDLLTKVFSPDALVHDEGRQHVGSGAIRDWWLSAKAKYDHVSEPIETERNGDEITVRAKVSGQFPNSPVTLNYFFLISDDKIVEMGIK